MQTLYVVYDDRCGLCTQLKDWLGRQPAYVNLQLVAAGSEEALRRFPNLPQGELSVISNGGEIWIGDHAWIIVLWALREYRSWAAKLASPLLLPMARQAFAAISRNRSAFSRWLGLYGEAQLRDNLSQISIPPCEIRGQP
jgi:predicted DCC family thiol-disulfide oxidoreductase YuxK